jgi:WD40 repeat protein
MKHDAFISYSHAADGRLAPALQQGLEQLAKPWYRLRALQVFRDETNLSASPQLWQSIVDELAQARWFLLLASPEAARSKWVTREVQWWLEHRDPDHLLILLTSGELEWNEAAGPADFDWLRSTALPRSLEGVFEGEPHFIDLRSVKDSSSLTLKHTPFRAAVLKIAAPLHGRSPDEMDGEAVRAHARNRRWAGAAVAGLLVLTGAALWQTYQAIQARDTALSRQLAAQSGAMLDRSVDTAMLLAVQAWRTKPTPEARSAMLRGLQLGPLVRFLPGHDSPIVAVALDPQAESVVVASESGMVTRVRADGSAPDWSYRSDQPIDCMALSPDGKVVASGRRDGRVLLLAPGRSTPLHVLEGVHKERITSLAFAPDGTRLVSGSHYGGIASWDVASGRALGEVPEVFNSSGVHALAFSDDGRQIYAAKGLRVVVWDGISRQLQGELGDGKTSMLVDAMAVVPGQAALTAVGWDDNQWRIRRWPTAPGGSAPTPLPTRIGKVGRLAYNADGRVLALGTHGGEVAFLVAGTEASFKIHKGEVRGIAISADGRWVASGGEDGRVALWDREAKPSHTGSLGQDTRGIARLAASPDGRMLLSGNSQGQLLWVSSGARVPALRVGPAVPTSDEPRSRARGVTAVAFAPDGRQVAVGLADGTTVLQPVDGSPETKRARDWGPGYPVVALAFSPDGATLVSAHSDGSVVLRDVKTAAPLGEPANIVNDSSDGIQELSFSADGRRLLVHTLRRGVVVREMAALAKASRATVEAALAQTARKAGAVVFPAVARSATGQWAWGNNRGQVELRASDDGPAEGSPLIVEGGLYVQALAFSPDRVTLAVAGAEPGILLWDLQERRPVDEPLRGTYASRSMAFTDDGRFLVTRSSDAELGWWSTDGDAWARLLCAIVNRHFSERERVTYLGTRRTANVACEAE